VPTPGDGRGDAATIAIGSRRYVNDFLDSYVVKVETVLDAIVEIVQLAPPEAPARQTANLLLRHCAAAKAAHLLRLLPPDVTKSMVARVDAAVLHAFCLINGLSPSEVETAATRIGLPIVDGGLGLRPLEWSRHTAYVAGWLQCAAGVANSLAAAIPALRDWCNRTLKCQINFAEVVIFLHENYGMDALHMAGASWEDVASVSRAKQQRVLTRGTIVVRRERWVATASPRDRQTLLSASSLDDRPGSGAWLTAIPSDRALVLNDEAFGLALRLRLGLHIASVGDRCTVFNQTSRSVCGRPLSLFADHAVGCARAARNAGHNHIRDWWADLLKDAGGRALTEQWVSEYAPRKAVRADVRAVHSPGEGVVYYDVVVAHPFTTGVPTGSVGEMRTDTPQADAAVGPASREKHNKYAPPLPSPPVPDVPKVQIVPLAFDTYGRWGKDAVIALRLAARRRMALPDARNCVPSSSAYVNLLQRWRAAGAIAVQRRNYDVWRDCLSVAHGASDPVQSVHAPAFSQPLLGILLGPRVLG
jgi:hypothetical protein